jgi:uncharacterized protein (UPF0261 family)
VKTIAVVGTFDSKGAEFAFVKDVIEAQGVKTLTIHTGTYAPLFEPDVSNKDVAAAVGADIEALVARNDRGTATKSLADGIAVLLPKLYEQGRFDGVISLGGSGGTAIATAGMRQLPVGAPKLMVSTVAGASNVSEYVGTSDVVLWPSIVDVAGLNSISVKIFTNAALAIVGAVKLEADVKLSEKPLVAATMFGVTTECVTIAKERLEASGYEVLVFHATGTGGKSMESLINAGYFAGVLDITTTEWCDELVGGIFPGGPDRLEAAGRTGIPQVVSTGALDMVNFGGYESVPERFKSRNLYRHNPSITLMRTTADENRKLGEAIAGKLNKTSGPTALFLPLKGVSAIDAPDKPFYGPEEDAALFGALRERTDAKKTQLVELDLHINDPEFAGAMADWLIAEMGKKKAK